jgi:hypothetical protein
MARHLIIRSPRRRGRAGLFFLAARQRPGLPSVQEKGSLVADDWITSCGSTLASFARQNSMRQATTSREVKYVSYHRSSVSSYRVYCCIFGAGLIPLGLAKSAGRGAEGFGGGPRYGKFLGSIRQRSSGHLSGGTLRSRRARSRSSGCIPDVEELDDRLQSDHGLVWTLC